VRNGHRTIAQIVVLYPSGGNTKVICSRPLFADLHKLTKSAKKKNCKVTVKRTSKINVNGRSELLEQDPRRMHRAQ